LPKLLGLNDLDKNNNDLQSNSENLVLTEIETQVAKSNAFQRARMIKQSQKKKKKKTSFDIEFTDGAIATLRIPPKLRLKIKNEHLGVRILAYDHRQYKSMS